MKINVLEIDKSHSQFLKFNKLEWHNLNYFFMKSLDLEQMENLQGGDLGCGLAVVGFNAASAGTVLACQ